MVAPSPALSPARSWARPADRGAGDAVWIAGLQVDYGDRVALDDVHLRIPRGEIFGLLGPNGAGKTTCFRVLASLLEPVHGEIEIHGVNLRDRVDEVRRQMAYMPDLAPLPSDLRAVEYLRFFAGTYGMRGKERDARVEECLEAVELTSRSRDICTRLSLGMRQRLALAKCLLHRPTFLILDEPASGMDPLARISLRDALRRQAAAGATIILSSHVLGELSDICTSIGLLKQGRLLDAGPIREVLARHERGGRRLVARAPGKTAELLAWLHAEPLASEVAAMPARDEVGFTLTGGAEKEVEIFRRLALSGTGVTGLRSVEASIEEVVVELSRASRNES